ncbi:MAG: hypothetical protein JNL02_17735 [Saprospiraceae bacterium]|nr:hypothetical protein [Saprospiraceae bacterium]
MKPDTQRVRELIGENEIDKAIQLLLEYSDAGHYRDLQDQVYLQKGNWSEFKRRRLAGVAEEKEFNSLKLALFNIARDLDDRPEEPEKPRRPEPPPPPPPPPQQYVARCYFNGDMNSYFVTPGNQVVMVNPVTNFSSLVATRVASMNPAFAWLYMFPNGFYYSIDHNGAIWGLNNFGMPMQMGHVQYL